MRIIEGKFRRLPLRGAPSSDELRPTARRLREILFAHLARKIEGARFLDLCAGSGAIGIEALSRGARHVTFVEDSSEACDFIAANLAACGVEGTQAEVRVCEVLKFLRLSDGEHGRRWNVAFFDPPYSADYEPVLYVFGSGAALEPRGGVLVVEHHHENKLAETLGVLRRWRVVRQGESCLSFYERRR
jgi:16S rRNA (guanine(966)-N(2))-methyltransferase RsmD